MSETSTLAEAFAAAQAEFPKVEPDAVNPHFRSKFVSLGHLIAKVRPVLNRHGLSVIQLPARDADGHPTLRTILLHTSGEKIEADAPLMLPKNDPQGQGSALTYMRRYALAAALGISDQEDDDGNAGSVKPKQSPERVEQIVSGIKALQFNYQQIDELLIEAEHQPLAMRTPEGLTDCIGSLSDEQAAKVEAALEKAAES